MSSPKPHKCDADCRRVEDALDVMGGRPVPTPEGMMSEQSELDYWKKSALAYEKDFDDKQALFREFCEAVEKFDLYIRNNESGEHGTCNLCDLIRRAKSSIEKEA